MSFPKTYINSLAESIKSEQDKAEKAMEDDDISMDDLNFLANRKSNNVTKEPEKKLSARERLLASRNKNK